MHLREYVRDDDLDVAIRTMLESFIQAQKFSVTKSLRRSFAKYVNEKRDHNELLLYTLQQLVKDAMEYRRLRQRIQLNEIPAIEIPTEELDSRARELNIFDLDTFYKSDLFQNHGFSLLKEGRKTLIVKEF